MKVDIPLRGVDDWGDGSFEAPRGNHKHRGIDYACYPDSIIYSNVEGVVTKFGYPYADALEFRYVEVTDLNNKRHQYFYVEPNPNIKLDAYISRNYPIGKSQDVAGHYLKKDSTKVMKNHVHYQILTVDNVPVNPETYDMRVG